MNLVLSLLGIDSVALKDDKIERRKSDRTSEGWDGSRGCDDEST